MTPLQIIFFGPPGCGKSHIVRSEAKDRFGIDKGSERLFEVTFHPEYGYGDFVAKLLPRSRAHRHVFELSGGPAPYDKLVLAESAQGIKIEYDVHAGPLLKALAMAFADKQEPVLLVIDEINRGNCAQIFGDVFQLLDRRADGWSEYGIELSELQCAALEEELKLYSEKKLGDLHDELRTGGGHAARIKLRLPPNLSIIATMNTSDESVYFMDTAFKRRWDFRFMGWRGEGSGDEIERQRKVVIEGTGIAWLAFLERLNDYIAEHFIGRNVDDKQVGLWFLRAVQAPALASLLAELRKLEGIKTYVHWKRVFPSAEKFDRSDNVESLTIKPDYEKFGLSWPNPELYNPENLAGQLIPHVEEKIEETGWVIPRDAMRNKLMFFLWDNVFARDQTPLVELARPEGVPWQEPRTFGDFASDANLATLVDKLMKGA